MEEILKKPDIKSPSFGEVKRLFALFNQRPALNKTGEDINSLFVKLRIVYPTEDGDSSSQNSDEFAKIDKQAFRKVEMQVLPALSKLAKKRNIYEQFDNPNDIYGQMCQFLQHPESQKFPGANAEQALGILESIGNTPQLTTLKKQTKQRK